MRARVLDAPVVRFNPTTKFGGKWARRPTRKEPMISAKRSRVDADELADLRAQLLAHVTTLLEADPEADGSPAWSLCPCSAGVPPQGAPGGSGSSVLPGRGPVTERPATATLLDADPEAMV